MSVLKISLPGSDVKSTKISNEVLDSLYPSPKINTQASPAHAGLIFLNWQSDNLVVSDIKLLYSMTHGYDYIPTSFGVYHFDNGSNKFNGILPFFGLSMGGVVLETTSTSLNVWWVPVDTLNPVSPFEMTIRYYILAERGLINQ